MVSGTERGSNHVCYGSFRNVLVFLFLIGPCSAGGKRNREALSCSSVLRQSPPHCPPRLGSQHHSSWFSSYFHLYHSCLLAQRHIDFPQSTSSVIGWLSQGWSHCQSSAKAGSCDSFLELLLRVLDAAPVTASSAC